MWPLLILQANVSFKSIFVNIQHITAREYISFGQYFFAIIKIDCSCTGLYIRESRERKKNLWQTLTFTVINFSLEIEYNLIHYLIAKILYLFI